MLQWIVTIGRPNLCQLVASLNRFGTYPRGRRLDLLYEVLGMLKQPLMSRLLLTPDQ